MSSKKTRKNRAIAELLGEVVGPDRKETEFGQQQIEHFGQRGHFEHRAKQDPLGQQLLLGTQVDQLFIEDRLGGVDSHGSDHHREHHVKHLACRRFEVGAGPGPLSSPSRSSASRNARRPMARFS